MPRVIKVDPRPDYRLWLRFADGTSGEVDLSSFAGKGVFQAWAGDTPFDAVSVGPRGDVRWGDKIDMCPDALYLQLTGRAAAEVFPKLRESAFDA